MFTLILGPMKSGKSHELIASVEPFRYTDQEVVCVQPKANVREQDIRSRVGVSLAAIAIESLNDLNQHFDTLGIDEVHMFHESDAEKINQWLLEGKNIIASGLDLDYRGKLMPIVTRLIELKPDRLINKMSVCDVCKQFNAQYSQVLYNNSPLLNGLTSVIPEDGTYQYEARCRGCFVKE